VGDKGEHVEEVILTRAGARRFQLLPRQPNTVEEADKARFGS
jgi:hypothetical protein